MTPSRERPDHLIQLLRDAYDVPPPDRVFTSQLLHRLQAEVAGAADEFSGGSDMVRSAPLHSKAWWRWGAVAAAAGVVIVTATLVIRSYPSRVAVTPPPVAQPPAAPTPGIGAANLAPPHTPDAGSVIHLGRLSLEDCIGRVPLIVRAKPIGWKDSIVEFAVLYVIYGTCSEKSIKLDMSGEIGFTRERARDEMTREGVKQVAEPDLTERTLAELGIVKNRDMILFLRPFAGHPASDMGSRYLCSGRSWDAPPRHPLDDFEKKIVETIARGHYLEPNPRVGDVLLERMREAALIVRAKLTEVGANGSTWKVIRTIRGQADKDTIIVNFDLFCLRARAIVNYTLRTEASATKAATCLSKREVEGLIGQETMRLIQEELIPGREAIIFVDECKTRDDGIHARLRHRLYADQEKKNLDELEKAIANPSRVIRL